MNSQTTPLERAFALARSGDCSTVGDIRQQMKSEGYSVEQISGPMLMRQLRALCLVATGEDS